MTQFATVSLRDLPETPGIVAPDGSRVSLLLALPRGGMATFKLEAGQTSVAVVHRTIEEFWYVLSGHGEMWRRQDEHEEVVAVEPGTCLTIPVGTQFQFRAGPAGALEILGITLPPWPGSGEAVAVDGPWAPTVPRGPS